MDLERSGSTQDTSPLDVVFSCILFSLNRIYSEIDLTARQVFLSALCHPRNRHLSRIPTAEFSSHVAAYAVHTRMVVLLGFADHCLS